MEPVKKRKVDSIEENESKDSKLCKDTQVTEGNIKDNLSDVPNEQIIYLEEIGKEDNKELSMRANRYIKTILAKWEERSKDNEKDASLLKETKKDLFPILVKLRKNTVDSNQLISVFTILYHLQRKEFLKSNESYMKLSIGNTAWPIGVINVGIHARSQARIGQSGANIMIDEVTRKWITALKRLITFTENNDSSE